MELKDLYPAVLAILVIGLVLGIGLFVMAETRGSIATDRTGSDVSKNISGTGYNNATTLSDASKDDYKLLSIESVTNDTGGTIGSSSYNFTTAGVITFVKEATTQFQLINISSTFHYDATDSPEEAINESITGLSGFADWIAVIVVVIAAAIVLGVVMKSFGQGARA